VAAASYDEALILNKDGLELHCEKGVLLSNTTPGTVVTVSNSYCIVEGAIVIQAGQTGIDWNGNYGKCIDTLVYGCSIGFDTAGLQMNTLNCRSIAHTTTGFQITGSYGDYRYSVSQGTGGATRGVHLSNASADFNSFQNCDTQGNTTAGWEVIVGADNNNVSRCSSGGTDGARVDAGANNTWPFFWPTGSVLTTFTQEATAATAANGVTWVTLFDGSAITQETHICGFTVTVAGAWAGNKRLRITNGTGATKIYPFEDYYTEGVDFDSGVQQELSFIVKVPAATGYLLQFCSSNAGDIGGGLTMALNNLDIQEIG